MGYGMQGSGMQEQAAAINGCAQHPRTSREKAVAAKASTGAPPPAKDWDHSPAPLDLGSVGDVRGI